jgi:hypothetical protein
MNRRGYARRLGGVAAVAVIGLAAACTTAGQPPPAILGPTPTLNTPTATPSSTSTPAASAPVSLLTGLTDSGSGTAVVVPVLLQAGRSAVGLENADIVSVEYAENGSVRLVGAFESKPSTKVGPLTQVRPSDAKLFAQITPIFTETGSPVGFRDAVHGAHLSLDSAQAGREGFSNSGGTFYVDTTKVRVPGSTRVSTPLFMYSAPGASVGSGAKTTQKLVVTVPGHATETWQYDASAKLWRANLSGTAVSATNLVVLSVPYTTKDVSALKSTLTWANPLGRGDARVVAGNQMVTGIWSKTAFASGLNMLSAAQQIPELVPGRTWILLVPPQSTVTAS